MAKLIILIRVGPGLCSNLLVALPLSAEILIIDQRQSIYNNPDARYTRSTSDTAGLLQELFRYFSMNGKLPKTSSLRLIRSESGEGWTGE